MEVAGVVLGAVPLILYALDSYHRVWEGIKDTRNHQQVIKTIRNNIFLQHRMLITTLQTLDSRFSKDTTMTEIQAALQNRHPNESQQFMSIICEMNTMMSQIAKDLCPEIDSTVEWPDASLGGKTWKWSNVKRSFRKERREEISNKLSNWNMMLANCGLEKREFLPDNEASKVNEVQMRFNENQTKKVRQNVQALHEGLSTNFDCDCQFPHTGNIQLNWHERKHLVADTLCFALSSETLQSQHSGTQKIWKIMSARLNDVELDSKLSKLQPTPSVKTHSLIDRVSQTPIGGTTQTTPEDPDIRGRLKRKTKLLLGIEINKSGPKASKPRSLSRNPPSVSFEDVEVAVSANSFSPTTTPTSTLSLCHMLQSSQENQMTSWRLPVTSPNFHKQISISFTDGTSLDHVVFSNQTIALRELLRKDKDKATNPKLGLDWKQRFEIAAALVWAVFHLCDSPWLQESLNDESIHFFLDKSEGTEPTRISAQPYLECSFTTHLMHSGSQPLSSAPSTQFQSKQIRNLMLYTLAIRLIELGRNKPFAKLRRQYQKSSIPLTTSDMTGMPSKDSSPLFSASEANSNSAVDTSTLDVPTIDNNAATICDDYKVAEQQIDKLKLDIGSFYAGAVECCLRFGTLERVAMNGFDNKSFLKSFFDGIIAPVQATLELRLNL